MELNSDTQTVSRMLALLEVYKNVGDLKAKAFEQCDMEWRWQILGKLFVGSLRRFLLLIVSNTFA